MAVTLTPDYFNQLGRENLPGLLGIVTTAVAEGSLRAEFVVSARLLAPNGFLHGGSVVALADTCAGYAAIAHLPEGSTGFTTIELKTNNVQWDIVRDASGKLLVKMLYCERETDFKAACDDARYAPGSHFYSYDKLKACYAHTAL